MSREAVWGVSFKSLQLYMKRISTPPPNSQPRIDPAAPQHRNLGLFSSKICQHSSIDPPSFDNQRSYIRILTYNSTTPLQTHHSTPHDEYVLPIRHHRAPSGPSSFCSRTSLHDSHPISPPRRLHSFSRSTFQSDRSMDDASR